MLAAALGRDASWREVAATDPDLDPLRGRPEFHALIAALDDRPTGRDPPRGL